MKKIFSIIICLCLLAIGLFALCSCDCKHEWNEGKITVSPSCEFKGEKVYTCSKCLETMTEELERVDHDMTALEWMWGEDLSSASLLMCCSYNVHHTTYADAEVKSEVKTVPTCGASGIMVTTATLNYKGK